MNELVVVRVLRCLIITVKNPLDSHHIYTYKSLIINTKYSNKGPFALLCALTHNVIQSVF